jgi:hypothetical protein
MIIVLCASHITSVQRLIYLNAMINSYLAQTIKKPLYISISYSDKKFLRELKSLIDKYECINYEIKFFIRDFSLSQFEHYDLLLNQNKEILKGKWILFTDDDDLWNNNRIETYIKYINTNTKDCFNIRSCISCDDLYVTSIKDINLNKCIECTTNEYFNYCIKYEKLIDIIKNLCKHISLSEPIFDLHLKTKMDLISYESYKNESWIYFYRIYFCYDGTKWIDY